MQAHSIRLQARYTRRTTHNLVPKTLLAVYDALFQVGDIKATCRRYEELTSSLPTVAMNAAFPPCSSSLVHFSFCMAIQERILQ